MKKAKWKSREEHNDYIHAECSGCGFQVESYDAVETGRSSTEYIKAKWKFCPKCGAKMTVQNKQKGASLRPGQKKKMKNIKENNFSKRGSNNEGSDY